MAIAFGGQLGTAAISGGTASFNTSAAVPSGGTLIILAHRFASTATTSTLSVATTGGLTWASAFGTQPSSGNIRATIFYAHAPSGLSSGTSLGVSTSSGTNDITIACVYYTGIDSAVSPIATNSAAAGTAPWASGTVAAASGNALIGGAGGDGTLRTSTTDAPGTERHDFNSATTGGSVTIADKLSVSGSDTLDGDWSGTLTHIGMGVAFQASGGGGGGTTVKNLAALGVG